MGFRIQSLTTFQGYAKAYERESFESVCDAVSLGEIRLFDMGLAATAECGALYTELSADAAQWFEDGRPFP